MEKILSMEGTTQGDPLAMAWYSLSTRVMSDVLKARMTDDVSAAGNIASLRRLYELLIEEVKKIGYYVNQSKSWLIVKNDNLKHAAENIFGKSVNITAEGKRHLGSVNGSEEYKQVFCEEKVGK